MTLTATEIHSPALERSTSEAAARQLGYGALPNDRRWNDVHGRNVAETSVIRPYVMSRRKRTLDITASATILLLLSPLLITVALIVSLSSKGPVFFRQTRCGARCRPFSIYKFRSMYIDDDTGPIVVQATRDDRRVTPIGRFMRRTSIDELPQLLNVLQGDMSLIGPRPHAISHDAFYGERIARYGDRFAARPGLSGLAQVSGARGATPQLSDMERRIELDLAYLGCASLKTDFRLIGATVREMMMSSTAY